MFSALRKFRVLPFLKYKDIGLDDALRVAEILSEAGLPAMELVFRRHSDSKAIRAIADKFPDFHIGAGGILNRDQLLRAMDAKAKFALAPGVNMETIREANKRRIMFAPGVCTPSDIENVLLSGTVDFQFFPAEQSGGVERLKAIIEPFEHLGVDILARGGITPENAPSYLAVSQVAAVSADWIIRPEYIENGQWDKIREEASRALKLVSSEN